MKQYRWGILSTGMITAKFATALKAMGDEVCLAAVASRTLESAQRFAEQYGVPKAYGSYEEMAKDPDIDIIYVATPHNFHYENMMLCLQNGKHVLCEKSFTVTAAQAEKVYALARQNGLMVMEAFWTKYVPLYRQIEAAIAAGEIGEVRMVTAQYGFAPTGAREIRKFDPALAGGALLDIGVYNIGFASMFLGYEPRAIHTTVHMNDVGTDDYSGILLEYEDGKTAVLSTAIRTVIPMQGAIYGSKGYITVPQYSGPEKAVITYNDGTEKVLEHPFEINGFEYQIREAMASIESGRMASSILTPEQSIAVMRIMDSVREKWGLVFPFER